MKNKTKKQTKKSSKISMLIYRCLGISENLLLYSLFGEEGHDDSAQRSQ